MRTIPEKAIKAFHDADALLITAGAGMGVDSGLPDFRGNEGFWKAYPPIAKLGISFVDMANPWWFERDPQLAWAFYGHRLNLYRRTEPHEGFHRLLEAGRQKPGGYFVFTSNVDGHFQKAGFDEQWIEECHGSINHLQCSTPCAQYIWDADGVEINVDEANFKALPPLPKCPNCGALARPNVLMFGDWSWVGSRSEAQSNRLSGWLEEVRRNKWKLVVVELGAGTAVPTVRYTSEHVTGQLGGTLIRINPREYQVPHGHYSIAAGALEGVMQLTNLV